MQSYQKKTAPKGRLACCQPVQIDASSPIEDGRRRLALALAAAGFRLAFFSVLAAG